MKSNKIIELLLFLVFTFVILPSCATEKAMLKSPGTKSKSVSNESLSLNLEFMGEEELARNFGRKNNPFISPVSFLKSNKLVVFRLVIANKGNSSVVMHLNKLEIHFGGVNANPYNRFQLVNFWMPRLKRQSEYKRWNMSILKNVIDKNVFDNDTVIQKGRSAEGYVVFKGPFPDYGKAVVYIPLFNRSGNMLKRYEIEFDF